MAHKAQVLYPNAIHHPMVRESDVRDALAEQLDGRTEVDVGSGIADIVTDTHVIEVKRLSDFCDAYHALGQALGYTRAYNHAFGTELRPMVHVYGTVAEMERLLETAQQSCRDFGVECASHTIPDAEGALVEMGGGDDLSGLTAADFIEVVLGASGKPVLVVRPSDGYVWVSTMLKMCNVKLTNFKSTHKNRRYLEQVACEHGMLDVKGCPDVEQLFKWGSSPFEPTNHGWFAHIDTLTKLAAFAHPPLEYTCHKIVTNFYAGRITTAQSVRAANYVADRLGIAKRLGEKTVAGA